VPGLQNRMVTEPSGGREASGLRHPAPAGAALERFKKYCGRLFNNATSSLTLTLSRWEREQPLSVPVKSASHRAESSRCHAEKLGAFPPLPAGEGRGDGERQPWTMAAEFPKPLLERTSTIHRWIQVCSATNWMRLQPRHFCSNASPFFLWGKGLHRNRNVSFSVNCC
jgi:hypothetical protein